MRTPNKENTNNPINYTMKYKHINTLAAIAGLALTVTSANAALLSLDFGNGGDIATGFLGQSSSSDTHSTVSGDVDVDVTGQQGFFDRNSPSGANQIDDLYRDFIFDNSSNGFTIAISGAGISANTEYELTFYAYDSSEVRPTGVGAAAGTTGTSLTGFAATTTAGPTSLTQHSATGNFTSNGSGVLTFLVDGTGNGGTGRSSINALEISVVPEPSTTALLGLGGLALILRRRK